MTLYIDLPPLVRLFFLSILFSFPSISAEGVEREKVDISFIVVDLKYNREQGVKICEVQEGVASKFQGYDYAYGEKYGIGERFVAALQKHHPRGWYSVSHICDSGVKESLNKGGYLSLAIGGKFDKVVDFKEVAAYPPEAIDDISSYAGVVIGLTANRRELHEYRKNYPGAIIMNAASRTYCRNKFAMNQFFSDELACYRPKWGLFEKRYSKRLSQQIIDQIGGEMYVIKPLSAYLGNGVIITDREMLDKELLTILTTKEKKLIKNKDPSYSYWANDHCDTFIVEEYIASDPLAVDSFEGRVFDPTMRIALLLVYDRGAVDLKFLGGYWKLPLKDLLDSATLNEKHKSCGEPCYYSPVAIETLREVEEQLANALSLLYLKMLQNESN